MKKKSAPLRVAFCHPDLGIGGQSLWFGVSNHLHHGLLNPLILRLCCSVFEEHGYLAQGQNALLLTLLLNLPSLATK